MNKTRDGLLLSSAQSAPLTIEEKWSINMGEAGEKTDCPVSVVLLSVPVWYPAGSGGGGGGGGCYLFTIRSSVLVTTSVLFVLFVLVVFFDRVINAISGHSWNSYGRGWGGGGGRGRGKGIHRLPNTSSYSRVLASLTAILSED